MNPRLARQLTQSLVAFSSLQGKLEFEIRSILFFGCSSANTLIMRKSLIHNLLNDKDPLA